MSTTPWIRHVEHVMGTSVTIDIRDHGVDHRVIAETVAWLHHVDATFSTYRDDSVITRFARGEISVANLDATVAQVLDDCLELRDETNGIFDISAVDAPNGTRLDPSGYVKGWAVEQAATRLVANGVANLSVNAGGDIVVRGEPRPGSPWRIGIRRPDEVASIADTVTVRDCGAVATSGTYERGAHLIDPRDRTLAASVASATVHGPDLGRADAYATALFVMGVEGLTWLDHVPRYSGYVITHDHTALWNDSFPLTHATT